MVEAVDAAPSDDAFDGDRPNGSLSSGRSAILVCRPRDWRDGPVSPLSC